jgi:pyruvate, water dikinase
MVKPTDLVVWLSDVDKEDVPYVGGKSANLGEMIQAKFPVPPGFTTTSYAYQKFIEENNLDIKVKHLLNTVNYDDPNSINEVSRHLKRLVRAAVVPHEIVEKVFSFYRHLGSNALVAIRSSATSEDSKDASFAGQQETYLNIKGESSVIEHIKMGWASLFEPRAIYYRHSNKLDKGKVGIALVVQRMVESDSSGIMFTIDPVTNDKTKIVVEAIFGLGEYIVQGRETPDHYEVDKKTLNVFQKRISQQKVALVKADVENKEIKLPFFKQRQQKIKDHHIVALAKLARDIEKHYYFPQDIEWAMERGHLFIVQTRPITTTAQRKEELELDKHVKKVELLRGDPASPGIGIGPVKILTSPKEISKVQLGDILVAPYTNPDYVPAMKKAAAIITERGGRTSHAAIVSREFGIPAVVGTEGATTKLHDNMVVSVDGREGVIYKGSVMTHPIHRSKNTQTLHVKTATKLYVNLAEPEIADRTAALNVDGVGLLRAEFMIAQIGTHPRKLIKDGKSAVFTNKLAEGLESICRSFYPRPVIYRATDFKTNEYSNLKGGKEFEPVEPNPMLGYRGAFRYINDPRVFNLELDAIKKVREKMGLNNLHMMVPFVRTVDELVKVKKLISERGIRRSATFRLYMMVEIPSNVILLEEFIKVGIDGVSIGSNDLTMLLLGLDRDNESVAVEFDERNEAVMWALEKIIKTCNRHGISSSICGQAPSVYPDLVEKLVEWGISGISVSPDAVDATRNNIYKVEVEMLKGHRKK